MNDMSPQENAPLATDNTDPAISPLSVMSHEFIAAASKTSDISQLGDKFRDTVYEAAEQREQLGWDIETTARRLVAQIARDSRRDMANPGSFLRLPLREVNVGATRTNEAEEKAPNTIADIHSSLADQKGAIASGIYDGLGKLEL